MLAATWLLLSTEGSLVGLGGLEPPTSRLSGARSSQLSYRPKAVLALHEGRGAACVSFDFPYGSSLGKERAATRPFKTKQQAREYTT